MADRSLDVGDFYVIRIDGAPREVWATLDATLVSLDVVPHDPHPDRCWRCDASPATTDVGCCRWCLDSLREASDG